LCRKSAQTPIRPETPEQLGCLVIGRWYRCAEGPQQLPFTLTPLPHRIIGVEFDGHKYHLLERRADGALVGANATADLQLVDGDYVATRMGNWRSIVETADPRRVAMMPLVPQRVQDSPVLILPPRGGMVVFPISPEIGASRRVMSLAGVKLVLMD
jgi:hypothetical protein